ncbi:MAG: hypothetical protein Q7U92_07895, partial [Bradyrhizobium sp.]|nr:hypothetical protein [Bradyrhizobium sp.]
MNKPALKDEFVEPIQQIHPTGKSLLIIGNTKSSPSRKNISVFQKWKPVYRLSHPAPSRGAFRERHER